MRVFGTRQFAREAERERLSAETLMEAVRGAERGIVAARLGGELIKLRVARPGRGKSGGYRTILAYRKGERAFFLTVYAKNEKPDVVPKDLAVLLGQGRVRTKSRSKRPWKARRS